MNLGNNYMTRSGGFNFLMFTSDSLESLKGMHTNKMGLYRSAVEHGAGMLPSNKIINELSKALNTVGNRKGFKRIKVKGEKGYFYKSVADSEQ